MTSAGPVTAVVTVFPEVDALVGQWRRPMDPSAEWGVPAHVTIMYPFMPFESLTADVLHRLADALAAEEPFDCTFQACRWFDNDVLWLEPDHAREYRGMTAKVEAAFPGMRLYGGEFSDVVPHLTIGDVRHASLRDLTAAEEGVSRLLPITERVDSVLVMAGSDRADSWQVVAALPLGQA